MASAGVRMLLEEASVRASTGAASAELDLIDRALASATKTSDLVGLAYARRQRAQHLERMARSVDLMAASQSVFATLRASNLSDDLRLVDDETLRAATRKAASLSGSGISFTQKDEARRAWRDTEEAWSRVGDGPGQIEAIVWQAILGAFVLGREKTWPPLLGRALALAEVESKRPRAAVAALVAAGSALYYQQHGTAPRDLLIEAGAVRLAEKHAPDTELLAGALHNRGNAILQKVSLESSGLDLQAQLRTANEAQQYHERALRIRERLQTDSLPHAASLYSLSVSQTWIAFSEFSPSAGTSEESLKRALTIQEALAPGSTETADTLSWIGRLKHRRGDPAGSRAYLQRSIQLRRKLMEQSRALGIADSQLAEFAGDPDEQWRRLRDAALQDVGILVTAGAEQGDLSIVRGDLRFGVTLSRVTFAYEMEERFLVGLGGVAHALGDPNSAIGYYSLVLKSPIPSISTADFERMIVASDYETAKQLVALARKNFGRNPIERPVVWNHLGTLAREFGDLRDARLYHEEALARAGPSELPGTLASLTQLAHLEGRDRDAGAFYARMLLAAPANPTTYIDGVDVTTPLAMRDAARAQRDVVRARAFEDQVIAALTENAQARSDDLFGLDTHYRLSLVMFERGDLKAALTPATRAWSIVRSQAPGVSGDEARQAFESRYQKVGGQLVRVQTALGQADAAFRTLEEGRAQALLQFASERGLARRLAPVDVWERNARAQAASDRAGRALDAAELERQRAEAELAAATRGRRSPAVVEGQRKRLATATEQLAVGQRAFTLARVAAETHWAEVRQAIAHAVPSPMAVEEARRQLPKDTLLLAFAVGEQGSTLFVVAQEGAITSYPVPVSELELVGHVRSMREVMSREGRQRDDDFARGLAGVSNRATDGVRVARDLYNRLFPEDVRTRIAETPRLLLAPDGALWDLPFAALVTNREGPPTYLGLSHALTLAPSLTMWARTTQAATATAADKSIVVVIGDPLLNSSPGVVSVRAGGELRTLSRDGNVPAPLPFAADEARQVAALYGAQPATGEEPTEAWLRQRAATADIIHLATHGYFNPFRAASSGIRLAAPKQVTAYGETDNDGALQAWEVMTQFQLKAQLVVLSACETGVGTKVAGEGLVGLTRAFQVAGAQSVVATQWKVADRSTAQTMVQFHRNLQAGLARDEALRRAMQTLAADPATNDPYYWAPFVLVGDSRPLRHSQGR
jgi:CHAT domain-containing protein